jgi:glycosyltransferase involved in cell wall biosynthesis
MDARGPTGWRDPAEICPVYSLSHSHPEERTTVRQQSAIEVRRPFFTIVVTTHNRAELVSACVKTCLEQTFGDFEVVVVDDGSVDDTVATLQNRWGARIRVITHPTNRGISPARYTGSMAARGEWVVVVDSDWELFPHTLERLAAVIRDLPPSVHAVRSRLAWDSGRTTPSYMPKGRVGYEARVRWADDEGGWDAARCLHRSVFEDTPYFSDRRGAMESLYELNLARRHDSIYIDDVLGRERATAGNSYLRGTDFRELVPRLQRDAADMLWMAETTLREHGETLRAHGPRQYRVHLRTAAVQAFLAGERLTGMRYAFRYLRQRPTDLELWAVTVIGLFGATPLAFAICIERRVVSHA